ncbi:MAG: CpXC domain-containing protein [Chloroflexota bacterium]
MTETALCRYQCPNCQAELEQEGYIAINVQNEKPMEALLAGTINLTTCTACEAQYLLPIPLVYHNGERELLIIYVPDLVQLSPEELNQLIEYPYSLTVTQETARRGIVLPEPNLPQGEEYQTKHPTTRFASLTQEEAITLLPGYLLRPTIVDGLQVLVAVAQAVYDGMSTQEVLDDMVRLQLINKILNANDPLVRRKVLHHSETYLNEPLNEVIQTLQEQMGLEGNAEMVDKLQWVQGEIERYKKSQQERLKKPTLEH